MRRRFLTDDVTLEAAVIKITNKYLGLEAEDVLDEDGTLSSELDNVLNTDLSEAQLAEESTRYAYDAAAMSLALRTTETYVWEDGNIPEGVNEDDTPKKDETSTEEGEDGTDEDFNIPDNVDENAVPKKDEKSTESESTSAKEDSIWVKFWNFVKGIFERIKISLITFLKRIQISLANSTKRNDWWKSIGTRLRTDIVTSNYSLNVRPMKISLNEYIIKKSVESQLAIHTTEEAIKMINNGIGVRTGVSLILSKAWKYFRGKVTPKDVYSTLVQSVVGLSVKNLDEELYGYNRARTVTCSEFFKLYSIEDLGNSSTVYRDSMNMLSSVIRDSSESLKLATKAVRIEDKEMRSFLKTLASGVQSNLSNVNISIVWVVSNRLKQDNIAYRLARGAVADLSSK